ncbi:hypothetical protein Tco_0707399 [Tanacetum coccineum]|uniref:Uncharacterized protein n=1 Tax=Tanacetum coccineum TaxID=301880 RepID=A0ABQ4YBN3_9ASTR
MFPSTVLVLVQLPTHQKAYTCSLTSFVRALLNGLKMFLESFEKWNDLCEHSWDKRCSEFGGYTDNALMGKTSASLLPLGGEQPRKTMDNQEFFFNKDLEYLRYGRKAGRPALSISKMKAAYYPDVGLEQLVPDQFWNAEECKYDIAAMYGISHWWVQRQPILTLTDFSLKETAEQ